MATTSFDFYSTTVLRYGPEAVEKYLVEAKEMGFDVIEISAGFLSIPLWGPLRRVKQVKKTVLKAKPELGIQFGSGGDSMEAKFAGRGHYRERRGLEYRCRCVHHQRRRPGHMIFEAANPLVFEWYIKNYGNEINLFINHSQILQLKGLRQNIWATSPLEAESPTRPSQPIGYTAAITRHGEAYHVNSI